MFCNTEGKFATCPIYLCLLVSITLTRGGKGEICPIIVGLHELSVSPSLVAKYA